MNQLSYFESKDFFGFVDLGAFQAGQTLHLIHGQECQHAQALLHIRIAYISPVLVELVGGGAFRREPQRALGGFAHLLAFAVGQQGEGHTVDFLAGHLAGEVHAADDVGPLVVSAELHLHTEVSGHDGEVIGLHQHVVEFEEGQTALAFHSLFECLCAEHLIDVEVGSHGADELDVVQRTEPCAVVDADCHARFRSFVLMTRLEHAVVALILPLLIELQEAVEELLELTAVLVDGVHVHELTHVGTAGGVSNHAGAAAQQHHRSVSVLLHVHHDDDLHEVTNVQAVCGGVESDVELDFLLGQKLANSLFICDLLDESTLLQHVEYIVIIAYIVWNKILHYSIDPLFIWFRTVCHLRRPVPAGCRRSHSGTHPWLRCRCPHPDAPSAELRFPPVLR